MGESGMSTSFPEDAEMHGGILTDATNPSAPSSHPLLLGWPNTAPPAHPTTSARP